MKYLRRLMWYISSRLIGICVVLAILIIGFYYAMNMANMQVVIKDGMAKRAQVVMMGQDASELSRYFMPSFVERDEVLLAARNGISPYMNYNVVGIDHRVSMSWMWCWPWDESARADIVEEIPKIDGRVKPSMQAAALEAGGESRLSPPRWQSVKYRVTLVRENGVWRIQSLRPLETIH
jgi:hypothetical protein